MVSRAFINLFSFAVVLCGYGFVPAELFAAGKVHIVVSVDWEGEDLRPPNLLAMRQFRDDYPSVPLQHFLNAAYYTKPGADADSTTLSINSVLRPGDGHGLHIHGWRSLFTSAGVNFRTGPSFINSDVDVSTCDYDCGHEVDIGAYTVPELRQVIDFSVTTLVQNGFKRPTNFRAGGWLANRKVLKALVSEGFEVDCSAAYAEHLRLAWGQDNLYGMVLNLWPNTGPTSQPYTLRLGAGLGIIEFPNNGSLADYVDGRDIFQTFVQNANLFFTTPSRREVWVSIGFHQETADQYLPHVRDGINRIVSYCRMHGISCDFVVSPR